MLQIIRILSLVGVWLSGLSLHEYLSVKSGLDGFSLCKIGQNFDCAAVSQSSWSILWGIPLASWGIVFYVFTFVLQVLATKKNLFFKDTAASIFLVTYSLASIFSIFLFLVSYFVIGKLCPLCIGLYLVNFLLLFVTLKYAKPLTLGQGLRIGLLRILKIPQYLLGLGSEKSVQDNNLVRLGTLLLLIIIFAATALQDYIMGRMIAPIVVSNQTIANWEKQPLEQINLVSTGNFLGDYSIGTEGAPIVIVEFSDFQCSACRRMNQVLKPLLKEYEGKVKLVYKNFPLDNACNPMIPQKFHEHACYAATLARCAGEQDKFWQMADYINELNVFDTSEDYQAIRAELNNGISSVGLDAIAMQECLSSDRELNRVRQDVAEGNRLGIQGTPSIWINGKRFSAGNVSDIKSLFDHILAKKKI